MRRSVISNVLAYYGRFVSLEKLRGMRREPRRQQSRNMLRAAPCGLTAQGYKKEDPEEVRQFSLPQIVFWNFNHFVVLKGIKGNHVYLNDPAVGRAKFHSRNLINLLKVILTFEPGLSLNRRRKNSEFS